MLCVLSRQYNQLRAAAVSVPFCSNQAGVHVESSGHVTLTMYILAHRPQWSPSLAPGLQALWTSSTPLWQSGNGIVTRQVWICWSGVTKSVMSESAPSCSHLSVLEPLQLHWLCLEQITQEGPLLLQDAVDTIGDELTIVRTPQSCPNQAGGHVSAPSALPAAAGK